MALIADRVLQHPTVRHFLLGFEETAWPAALESAAVVGVCAMTARYGSGVRLADVSCLRALARWVDRQGGWPGSLADLPHRADSADSTSRRRYFYCSGERAQSARRRSPPSGQRKQLAGRSLPPRRRGVGPAVAVEEREAPVLHKATSAPLLPRRRTRRKSAPPAVPTEDVFDYACPKDSTVRVPSRRRRAAVELPNGGGLQVRIRRRTPSVDRGGGRALQTKTYFQDDAFGLDPLHPEEDAMEPVAATARAGVSDDADEPTSDWYQRLMSKLKRLDSQCGNALDSVRVVPSSALGTADSGELGPPQAAPMLPSGGLHDEDDDDEFVRASEARFAEIFRRRQQQAMLNSTARFGHGDDGRIGNAYSAAAAPSGGTAGTMLSDLPSRESRRGRHLAMLDGPRPGLV